MVIAIRLTTLRSYVKDLIIMLIEAFSEAFGADADLYEILWLSIQVSLTALLISIVLGLPIGTTLAIANFPGKTVCITVINSLMGMPPVVVGLLVYLALSRSGPFGVFGLLYTPSAMVIAQVLLITPIIAALTYQVMEDLHKEYRDLFFSLSIPLDKAVAAYLWDARYSLDHSYPCRVRSSDIRSRRGDDRRREYRSPHTGDDHCNRA